MLKSRSFLSVMAATVVALSLAACSGPPAPVTYATPAAVPAAAPAAPAPTTIVNAAPASHGSDMLVGGVAGAAAGYMLANAQNKGSAAPPPTHAPTVVQQTVIHKTVNVHSSPPSTAPSTPRPDMTKTTLASATPSPSYRSSATAISSVPSYRSSTSPTIAMRSYTPSTSLSASSRR